MLSKFPSHIKFDAASADAQHTLWETPRGSSGKDYISFLNKRHWSYYINTVNVGTLHWNCDLQSLVNKYIPEAEEQSTRSSSNETKVNFRSERLLGVKRIISDTYLT